MRQNRPRRLGLESLEARRVLDSTVVINELFYHPAENASTEWIELHNQMSVDMDLSAWSLADGINYTFPDGTVIGGGEYLVIAADPVALEAATGIADAMGPFNGRMSNSGETVSLFSRAKSIGSSKSKMGVALIDTRFAPFVGVESSSLGGDTSVPTRNVELIELASHVPDGFWSDGSSPVALKTAIL